MQHLFGFIFALYHVGKRSSSQKGTFEIFLKSQLFADIEEIRLIYNTDSKSVIGTT